ncbi:TPA: ATPase [Candidatus Poribacteria bacterium]|nr:ATPase [Candidatus Poribacteria bacterium]
MRRKRQEDLVRELNRIDGRGYKAYRDIEGEYDFSGFTLYIDHAQSDPYAPPSRMRVRVPQEIATFPEDTYHNKSRNVALCDYLARCFHRQIPPLEKGIPLCKRGIEGIQGDLDSDRGGTGKSGLISIDKGGQEILERTAVFVNSEFVEARFVVGLPARGRRVLGRQTQRILCQDISKIVELSLRFGNLDSQKLYQHIELAEDQNALRNLLDKIGLVAFIADGSILPRATGIHDTPLKSENVVPFQSPPSLRKKISLPNRGVISGMGIPRGVTLIVGGGYHGKSTVLRAIERGVYNHIPGDGREFAITVADAVKIRSEDGRRVEKVDISPFINNLPQEKDTRNFSTDDASGSTSQAANIIEALEVGAKLLLFDEDTSATNFMIRDQRMQKLVAKAKEPITPFIDKVKPLYTDYGVSSILVIGGSGDYFDVADTVIMMDEFVPRNVTTEAKKIAAKHETKRRYEGGENFGEIKPRIPLADSFDPSRGRREVKISPKGLHSILFGTHNIDLSYIEQLVDSSQTRAIGEAILYAKRKYMDGKRTLSEILSLVQQDIVKNGLDILSYRPVGDRALPRRYELAAAINRLRTLEVFLQIRAKICV